MWEPRASPRTRRLLGAAAGLAAAASPAAASAATVLAPADGATVASRPSFRFDVSRGTAGVELAKVPQTLGLGYGLGAFIDTRYVSESPIGGAGAPPGIARWAEAPIVAGRWYWHVRIDLAGEEDTPAWGPTMRLRVRDEPARLEAFAVRAERLRPTRACRSLVRLRGRVASSDNDATPRVRLRLRVRAGDAPSRTLRVREDGTGRYAARLCSRASRLRVTPVLVDRAGQVTRSRARAVRVA